MVKIINLYMIIFIYAFKVNLKQIIFIYVFKVIILSYYK